MSGHILLPAVQAAVSTAAPELSFWAHAKTAADTLKPLAEVLAYLAAAIFFLYKAAAGYLVTDLTIRLNCRRKPAQRKDADYLSVVVTLKKGSRGALRLYDAQLRVTSPGDRDHVPVALGQASPKELIGIERLSYNAGKVRWVRSTSAPHLNLAPGDASQFAGLCEVPADQPCSVDVVVFGKRWQGIKTAQWRASDISLPNAGFSEGRAQRSAVVLLL